MAGPTVLKGAIECLGDGQYATKTFQLAVAAATSSAHCSFKHDRRCDIKRRDTRIYTRGYRNIMFHLNANVLSLDVRLVIMCDDDRSHAAAVSLPPFLLSEHEEISRPATARVVEKHYL